LKGQVIMGVPNGNRQHGTPILIDDLGSTAAARVLERLVLQPGTGSSESYGEAWVQSLIHRFPQTLPIEDIEPGLAGAVSVCMEMPTAAGSVDNLLVTARGDLVLVECKLWRNPEARREVVAQIMDYAHCMASWSYEDLEAAISRGTTPDGERPSGKLYDIVGGEQVSEEAAFVDAVARNLRLGRFLLLLVGDGIREGVETLADYLQSHPGLRFTLGLVELAIHRMPGPSGFIDPLGLRSPSMRSIWTAARSSPPRATKPTRATPPPFPAPWRRRRRAWRRRRLAPSARRSWWRRWATPAGRSSRRSTAAAGQPGSPSPR
jgi:hypothetical protein